MKKTHRTYVKVASELVYFLKIPIASLTLTSPSETLKATEAGHVSGPQSMNAALPSERPSWLVSTWNERTAKQFPVQSNFSYVGDSVQTEKTLSTVSKFLIALEQLKVFLNM